MAIIISKNGKNAQKIDESAFTQEDYLQKYKNIGDGSLFEDFSLFYKKIMSLIFNIYAIDEIKKEFYYLITT